MSDRHSSKGDTGNGKSILLVDDESAIRKVFTQYLRYIMPQIKVEAAPGGKEALEAVSERDFSICILDLHMPGMDGLALFDKIKKMLLQESRAMPFIFFCTGYAPTPSLELTLRENQGCRVLRKPVPMSEISNAIKQVLQSD